MDTAQENLRYSGLPTTLRYYMNEVLVECPKCQHVAIVTSKQSYDTSNNKLVCHTCGHTEKADDLIRYFAIIQRACDNCGFAIEQKLPYSKEKISSVTLPCPHCSVVRNYKPKYESVRQRYQSHGKGDPIFNLPLWLQTSFKGEVLWAYNREHLSEIRNYVVAKLRERQTTYYTTMVEKLPNFIKIAKNREALAQEIDKLAKK